MLQARTTRISIRPKQPLHLLAILGFFAIGVINAWQIYGFGASVFVVAYVVISIAFLLDKIEFDGVSVKRVGPAMQLLSWLGKTIELEMDDIETIGSYASSTVQSQFKFQTVIVGEDVRWIIKSNQKNYEPFIKALFKAVNPHILDPLSTELLLYWRADEPEFKIVKDDAISAYRIERWRRKAIALSFEGEFQTAASYFKMAHENSPLDPQIPYDIARFLRRRAMVLGAKTEQGEADLIRSETYLRMAGRLAWEKKNARILERVGESFFEFRQLEPAKKYFDLATKINPVRVRANIGLGGVALQESQGARAVYAFNQAAVGAEAAGATGLVYYAQRKAEYYERLMRDEDFLSKEAGWMVVLTQLKWARRVAFSLFLLGWMLHLSTFEIVASFREMSRELSATGLILWICTLTASQIILAYRRE